MSTFDLTPQDLLKLNDADLRDLVRRLCEAELVSQNLPTSAVLAGGAQEAADGGLDVVVKLNQPLTSPNFIPRSHTGFQVKKHGMTPKDCQNEMLYHSKVPKSVISELAAASGAYIMVTTDNCSDSMLKNRLAGMQRAVSTLSNHGQLLLDFYGIDRLNQWLSLFPGIQLWVRERIGQPLSGWQSHGRWTIVPTEDNDAYIADDLPHLTDITANQAEQLSLTQGLNRFRTLLKNPGAILRLVGLSGTGKTRFIQALFETAVGTDALLPAEAVYADLSDAPVPAAGAMVEQLMAENRRAIVIIDNCPPETHRQLIKRIRATTNPSVSLLTVEYDVADDEPEETHVFRLETSAPSLTVKLLQRRFPSLSSSDANRLDQLSDGNTRLALALAKHVSKIGNLSQFSDQDLFKRLFEQRHSEDRQLLREAQALSLIYSFRVSDDKPNELQVLANIAELRRCNLQSAVATLKERQLVQSRGLWHAVLPQALANHLTVQALASLSLRSIQQSLSIPKNNRLLRSYAHRLGTLPPQPAVISAAAHFIPTFSLRERLLNNDPEALMLLEFIAPVIEDEVLSLLEDILGVPDFRPKDQKRLARLLWHLAYEEQHFKKAVQLLLKLAQISPDDIASCLRQLFSLFLSGTLSTPAYRLGVLTELIDNDHTDVVDRELPFLFATALKSDHWTLTMDCAFGSQSRSMGWNLPSKVPASNNNPLHMWYSGLLDLLSSDNLAIRPAFGAVVDAFLLKLPILWQRNVLCTSLEQLCLRLAKNNACYTKTLQAIIRTLRKSRISQSDQVFTLRLKMLLQKLQKGNSLSDIRLTLTYSFQELADGTEEYPWPQATAKVQQQGCIVGQQLSAMLPLLEDVLWLPRTTHFVFGLGLSESSPSLSMTLHLLILSYEKLRPEAEPLALLGFLAGIEDRSAATAKPLIEQCLQSSALQPYSVQLLFAHEFFSWKIPLLLSMGKDLSVPLLQFRWLGFGQRHTALSDVDFLRLLRLLSARPNGLETVLDLAGMRLLQEETGEYTATTDLLRFIAECLLQLLNNGTAEQFRQCESSSDLLLLCRKTFPTISLTEQEVQVAALCHALCRADILVSDCSPFIQAWLELSPCLIFNAWERNADVPRLIQRLSDYFNSPICHYSVNRVNWKTVVDWCGTCAERIHLMLRLSTILVQGNAYENSGTEPGLHLSERVQALLNSSKYQKKSVGLIIRTIRHPHNGSLSYAQQIIVHRDACAALLKHPSKIVRNAAAPLIDEMTQEIRKWQACETRQEQENSAFE